MSLRRALAALVALSAASALAAPPARAEPTAQDKAQADVFFRDGRALMNARRYAEACGKFAESQRLDPAPGTLVNLALCHEKEGRTASAWAELNEVAERPGDDSARAPFARQRAAELEKRLSRVRVRVDDPAPDEVVTIDGRPHGASAWGEALPLDPGEHAVEGTAPGRTGWRTVVRVDAGPATLDVFVPKLAPAPAEPPPSAPAPSAAPAAPSPRAAPDAPPASDGAKRTAGLVVGAAGLVGIGVGTFFGLRTLSTKSDADALCPNNRCAGDPRVAALDSDARGYATVSTIGFGVGLAALAVGVYLVLTAHPDARAHVAFTPAPGGARLEGSF